ncbi:MAG: hypothetical protein WCH07_04435 [Deltaproteobacteria bacterium]
MTEKAIGQRRVKGGINPSDRVIFRTWPKGDVIALFPDIEAGLFSCSSYMRVGQHGAADYRYVVEQTKQATIAEYADLAVELKQIGYNLRVLHHR